MGKRIIRFPLKMKNGAEVRTLDELKENFDLESVLGYFTDGKLKIWFADRYYDDKAEAISALSADMPDLNAKLCEILEVEYQAEEDETDLELIAKRREKLKILSSITDNREILDNVDIVAMSQDELFDILDESPEKVYLYGEKFNIPSGKKNVFYIGVNKPLMLLKKGKYTNNYEESGICFKNVEFEKGVDNYSEKLFLSGKYKEAFPIIKEAAENGDPRSMYIMGLYYDGGYGTVKINEYERNKWYKKALPYNYSLSTFRYANDCLVFPLGCTDDFRNSMEEKQKRIFSQVVHEIKAMAKAGDVFAQAELGCIYFAGLGVEKNKNKSAEWYRKAADNGCAFAQTNLAHMYYRGQGVSQDYHASVELYKKATDQCYAIAQFNLAYMYKNGNGVSKDIDIAMNLLKKATVQEHSHALIELIEMNRKNTDINVKDDEKVIALLEKLAEQGSINALFALGSAYDSFYPKYIDKDKAIMWYKKAAEQGHVGAIQKLGRLYGLLTFNSGKDISEAIKWFTKAAEQGKISSQYKLGEIYEKTNDRDKAIYWYKKAAENGWEDAIEKLKNM